MSKKNTRSGSKRNLWLIICTVLGVLFIVVGISQKSNAAVSIIIGLAALVWSGLTAYKKYKANKGQAQQTVAETKDDRPTYNIPDQLDGAFVQYKFSVPMEVTNYSALLSAAQKNEWQMSAQLVGNDVHILTGGTDVGILHERADMVKDWVRNGDPYTVVLQNLNTETKACTVFLGFYRDKRKGQENREQTVVPLQPIKNEEKQLLLSLIAPGFELDFETEDDKVYVTDEASRIGRLPQNVAKKYLSSGAYGVFFEGTETDDETDAVTPSIRIFW